MRKKYIIKDGDRSSRNMGELAEILSKRYRIPLKMEELSENFDDEDRLLDN